MSSWTSAPDLGGPACQLARRIGDHVVGIDITPAYVDAARDLAARAGLGDIVHFHACEIRTCRGASGLE
ncbi:hypothetical protein ABZS88_40605 [Streptomyces sp. NPDC005480]|uniref:hypothetical protein n=1 Tax=Streptomyces sp. NPDC005480 TaxID=3154880 RepID=UPI0033BB8A0B